LPTLGGALHATFYSETLPEDGPHKLVVELEAGQALFMPSVDQQGLSARLIAPREVYAENRPLLLYVGEREVAVRCGALVEQAPDFDCFEFTGSCR